MVTLTRARAECFYAVGSRMPRPRTLEDPPHRSKSGSMSHMVYMAVNLTMISVSLGNLLSE